MKRLQKVTTELSQYTQRCQRLNMNHNAIAEALEESEERNRRLAIKYEKACQELEERDAEKARKQKRTFGSRLKNLFGCASAQSGVLKDDFDDQYMQGSSQQ